MAETTTSHFGWTMPDPGASANTWGATLNATTQKIDQQVYDDQQAAVQGGAPVGSGALWFAATPPANWLICDGSSLDTTTYAALFAVIGTKYGSADASHFNLPNLKEAFAFGAGATHALAATGGAATVTLDATMIPAHTHPATQAAHGHTATQPAHNHADQGHGHPASASDSGHVHSVPKIGYLAGSIGGSATDGNASSGVGYANVTVSVGAGYANLAAAQPAITVTASQPAVTVSANTGGGAAHNNLPPFLAINFIIKYQ